MSALAAHMDKQANKSAYVGDAVLYYLDSPEAERRAVSAFSINKYLTRYGAKQGDKAANPQDLLKLAHYALMEYEAATAVEDSTPKRVLKL
jgi:hypothetical protein